jgi:hypothetical protein
VRAVVEAAEEVAAVWDRILVLAVQAVLAATDTPS